MGNTTHLRGNASAALASLVYGKSGGSTLAAKCVYVKNGGVVKGIYSVLSPSGTSSLSGAGSGASTSGTATTSAGANVSATGNIGTLSYSWAYLSGDRSITCSSNTSANPTFSRAFSGVSNGTTSSPVSGVWRCTITDGDTG